MTDYIRPQFPPKTHPVDDVPGVRRWRNSKWFCAACGREGDLTCHHIIGGAGGRSDEPVNLLALCWSPCHQLAEGLDVRDPADGLLFPKLTLAICLSLKARADPGELCLPEHYARLEQLRGRRLPEPAPIPIPFRAWFRREDR